MSEIDEMDQLAEPDSKEEEDVDEIRGRYMDADDEPELPQARRAREGSRRKGY